MAQGVLAVCLDCGDTLIDEGTEIRDESGISVRADLIPGAAEAVRQLKQRGYKLALIADGFAATFDNLLDLYGLRGLFDVFAVSELLGVEKPHPQMFQHALSALGIDPANYGRTIMVGNNLERDIRGANALGMISVWLDWAPRRSKIPACALEIPRYTITLPLDLLLVIDLVENDLTGHQS
jgi:HAD superfamily hydrolase (TIGR01549 family)